MEGEKTGIQGGDDLKGFNLNFTKKLLNGLETLFEQDRVFEEGNEKAKEQEKQEKKEEKHSDVTEIAKFVMMHLEMQLKHRRGFNVYSHSKVVNLLDLGKEFVGFLDED